MTFRQEIGQASQALDLNQRIGQLAGYGSVDGGEPSIGARPFAIDFREATTIIDGEEITLDATSVDLEDYAIPGEYRKAVVYIAPNEDREGGEYRVAAGEPSDPKPEGALRFDTYEPAPPDLSTISAVPVVEVWLGANAQNLIDDDFRDRRFESTLTSRHFIGQTGSFNRVIDGAGVEHEGLGSAGTNWEDIDIVQVINEDPDHGTDAYHNYFSGSHDDLSDIATDDHHTRRTDIEDRDAVRGSLDAADLAGDLADIPGMHLGIPDGVDAQWVRPPRAEGPLIASGTATHTGGSDTTIVVDGVPPTQIGTLGVSVGESTAPSWSADYAYTESVNTVWDSTAQTASAEITLSWTTDPGTGNDLTVEYLVWDMDPAAVTDLYDDQDAAAALQGSTIDPAAMAVAAVLDIPVYDDLPTTADLGDTVIATGNGTAAWGIYQYDGTDWNGPYTSGLTALSDLTVDVAKDWNAEPITNVGDPVDPGDLLTLNAIETHSEDPAVHHAPPTSADIDHALMSNVQPDQHHPPLTGEAVGDVVAGELMDVSTTTAWIPNNDAARIHAMIDSDETAEVIRGSISDESGSTPSGLALEIEELGEGSQLYSQTTQTEQGTLRSPLVRITGPRTIEIRVYNGTGTAIAASGSVSYHLDQQETSYGNRIVMVDDTGSKEVSARQGVVIEPNRQLAGVRAELSDNISGATTAYIQESGGGAILAQEDISNLSPGEEIELRSSRAIKSTERVYVSADAGGSTYIRGRGNDTSQFPYTSNDFDVVSGVYTTNGSLSDSNRYNYDEITAIRLE